MNKKIFLFLSVVFGSLIYVTFFAPKVDPYSFNNYKPEFKSSDLELAIKTHPRLYYKTTQTYSVGQAVPAIEIVSVYAPNQGDHFEPKVTVLDNVVDGADEGYVYFDLAPMATDCMAIYMNGLLTAYDQLEISLLPTPSDTWLCAGYDFKKRQFTYKPEHTEP